MLDANKTDESKRWKRKFYESLDDVERHERRLGEVEALLYQCVSRLAVGTYGLDAGLDERLDALRAAAREKQGPERIAALATKIRDYTPAPRPAEPSPAQDTSPQPDPEPPSDPAPAPTPARESDAGGTGWRQWFGGRAPREAREPRDAPAPRPCDPGVLEAILADLSLCETVRAQAEQIRDALRDSDPATVVTRLAGLAGQLRNEIEHERAEMRRYLEAVDERLDGLGDLLGEQSASHADAEQVRLQLDRAVTGEVAAIRRVVVDATELDPLKVAVSDRLAAIETRVSDFVTSESERMTSLEQSASAMRERLAEAEHELKTLEVRLDEAHQASLRDALTGCYNRGAFDARLVEEHARATRREAALGLLIFDLDHFKRINDTYGHPAGDRVLIETAQALRDSIRASDFLARYGGEEFVLLLPDTDVDMAAEVAEKLRRTISAKRFVNRGERVVVTASCGVAAIRAGEGPPALLKRADEALYAAKRGGRDRVVAA